MALWQRHKCLRSLRQAIKDAEPAEVTDQRLNMDSVELEHAILTVCRGNVLTYPYYALRALQVIRAGKALPLRHAPGETVPFVLLLSLPSDRVFENLPCPEAREAEEALRVQGESLLRT